MHFWIEARFQKQINGGFSKTAYATEEARRQVSLARSKLGLWIYSNIHEHKNHTPHSEFSVAAIATEFCNG